MSEIKFKFKKLTPMKIRNKINKKSQDSYFLKLSCESNDDNWFNLKDIYEIIEYGNCINPITQKKISKEDISKIKHLYNNMILIENTENHIEKDELLQDHIEIFENQIEELYNKQEEI